MRYCDDFVALCPTGNGPTRPGSGRPRAGTIGLHCTRTRPRSCARGTGNRASIPRCHHRMVESRKRRGRYWMNKWPSHGPWPPSGQGPGPDCCGRSGCTGGGGRATQPRPARWCAYFRQGKLLGEVRRDDSYVPNGWPSWPAGSTAARGSTGQTLHLGLAGEPRNPPNPRTVRYPAANVTVNGVGEPCAGEPHAGSTGGDWKRSNLRHRPAPTYRRMWVLIVS